MFVALQASAAVGYYSACIGYPTFFIFGIKFSGWQNIQPILDNLRPNIRHPGNQMSRLISAIRPCINSVSGYPANINFRPIPNYYEQREENSVEKLNREVNQHSSLGQNLELFSTTQYLQLVIVRIRMKNQF